MLRSTEDPDQINAHNYDINKQEQNQQMAANKDMFCDHLRSAEIPDKAILQSGLYV